jgi:rRNA-processing protein FCF1
MGHINKGISSVCIVAVEPHDWCAAEINIHVFMIDMKGKNLAIRVILDSNFLFVPSQFQIDIFDELAKLLNQRFEPILLSSTYEELLTMAKKGSPSRRKQASLALKLAEKCRPVNIERSTKETNDDVILRTATEWKSSVATNDRELRKKLRKKGVSVIFLRGKSRLALEGDL